MSNELGFSASISDGKAIPVPIGSKIYEFSPDYISGFEDMNPEEQKKTYDELDRINPSLRTI